MMGIRTVAPDEMISEEIIRQADVAWLETPVDICPDCYSQRDVMIPLVKFRWHGYQTYYQVRGARIGPADSVRIEFCPVCQRSEVARGYGAG